MFPASQGSWHKGSEKPDRVGGHIGFPGADRGECASAEAKGSRAEPGQQHTALGKHWGECLGRNHS